MAATLLSFLRLSATWAAVGAGKRERYMELISLLGALNRSTGRSAATVGRIAGTARAGLGMGNWRAGSGMAYARAAVGIGGKPLGATGSVKQLLHSGHLLCIFGRHWLQTE